MQRALGLIVVLPLVIGFARADQLDDLLALARDGSAGISPAAQQKMIQTRMAEASAAYRNAMAENYLVQVKASLLDPENHGGWPFRSTLVYMTNTRGTVTSALKSRFDRKPEPIVAYALLCPALYARDEALLKRALAYLEKNDPFLHEQAQALMTSLWVPFINNVINRQSPASKKEANSPAAKDDPFSVLPK